MKENRTILGLDVFEKLLPYYYQGNDFIAKKETRDKNLINSYLNDL
jgi:hypothetical protein